MTVGSAKAVCQEVLTKSQHSHNHFFDLGQTLGLDVRRSNPHPLLPCSQHTEANHCRIHFPDWFLAGSAKGSLSSKLGES